MSFYFPVLEDHQQLAQADRRRNIQRALPCLMQASYSQRVRGVKTDIRRNTDDNRSFQTTGTCCGSLVVYAPQKTPISEIFLSNTRFVGTYSEKNISEIHFDDTTGFAPFTFSMVPPAKPTTTTRPFHAMHFKQSGQNNCQGKCNLKMLKGITHTVDESNGIVYDVNSTTFRDRQDLLLPPWG